ncbi:surface carbohydrate biosynthesis protein [uncultured Neptuniibacter sp.]|uniref:surface carbohydrate biosynthesis protein n=1 Tax=uncultured Neptuniibacter sp. TaxID=502143 RepID=UPI00260F94CB|nr:surface carbohydrate biosynthesis protein [uncultured Neptuniibacter sp.]
MKKIASHIIDSPRRDLEWRLILAKKLSERGVASFLGSAHKVRRSYAKTGGVLVGRLGGTSGRSKFDKMFLEEIARAKGKVFYFHDEGGAFKVNDYERETKLAYPEELFEKKAIHKVYFWGQAQYDLFKDCTWIDKGRILGCPRFDIYAQAYDKPDNKDVMSSYVLINSRFSNVNTVPDDPTALSRRMFEIRCEGGESERRTREEIISSMYKRWAVSAKDFIEFVDMVANTCLSFPDIQFKFRPHPAENEEWYIKNFENLDNLIVEKQGDVHRVMRDASLVIHSECTTGLEAELLGKPHINFVPFPEEEGEGVVGLRSIGMKAATKEDVKQNLIEFFENSHLTDSDNSIIKKYIHNISSLGEATTELAQDISEFFEEIQPHRTKLGLNRDYLYLAAKDVLRDKYHNFNRSRGAIGKFVWPDRHEIIKLWCSLGGRKDQINVKRTSVFIRPEKS